MQPCFPLVILFLFWMMAYTRNFSWSSSGYSMTGVDDAMIRHLPGITNTMLHAQCVLRRGREAKCMWNFVTNLKERDGLEHPGVDWRMILKCVWKKGGWGGMGVVECGLDTFDLEYYQWWVPVNAALGIWVSYYAGIAFSSWAAADVMGITLLSGVCLVFSCGITRCLSRNGIWVALGVEIAHLRQECHNSKFGNFELLV